MMKFIAVLCGAGLALTAAGEVVPPTPVELWRDFDPDKGDFKEAIVSQETKSGIYSRDSYISAYVNGEEVRVFCKYAVKAGAKNAPGLLNVHGWMATANIDAAYVQDGWAQMSFDYCGESGTRAQFTKYPEKMDYGRMERGKVIHSKLPDGRDITDPKQTSHYLWFAIQRRVMSYLCAQKEVDTSRIGAKGYSYGGTLMWNLGMDPRVKAVVAYFGIGWIEYYRNKGVWMYNVPYVEPPMTPGEKLFLATVESQAHAPHITAATLWLTGSNDHHGGHERSETTFKMFKPGVPWSFAVQVRGHHNTDKLGDGCKLWLEKYVLGKDIAWPARPKSELVLGKDGIPELRVTPASPDSIASVEIYEAQKTPNNIARSWRDAEAVRSGNTWSAQLPVMNVDDYVFGYATIRYANNIVISSDFSAAIPSKLGKAVATDQRSDTISDGAGHWSEVAPVEGVGGVKGFRALNNTKGTENDQFGDPRWKAPDRAALTFRFYCTEPQKLTLVADGRYETPLDITASDHWQTMTVRASGLREARFKQALQDWSKVTKVGIKPRAGSDITKVVFADFKWAAQEPGKLVAAAAGKVGLTREMASRMESFHHVSVDKSWDGHPIRISGRTYERGLGVHAPSEFVFPLDGQHAFFHVVPGPDDEHNEPVEGQSPSRDTRGTRGAGTKWDTSIRLLGAPPPPSHSGPQSQFTFPLLR